MCSSHEIQNEPIFGMTFQNVSLSTFDMLSIFYYKFIKYKFEICKLLHSFFIHNLYSVPTFLESGLYVHLLYMYSILGRGSFCFNYCLNSAWHGGDQFVALLRWYGSPGFFDSGLQLICIVGSGVSHLPLDNTP